MIKRYSRKEMTRIWRAGTRFYIWFLIEAHAGDAMADLGEIPRRNAEAVWKAGKKLIKADSKEIEKIRSHPSIKKLRKPHITKIKSIDARIRHDIIAFLTHLAKQTGSEECSVRASGDDLVGRARHLPRSPAGMWAPIC